MLDGKTSQCILNCTDNIGRRDLEKNGESILIFCGCCTQGITAFYFLYFIYLLIECCVIIGLLMFNNIDYLEYISISGNIYISIFVSGFFACMLLFSNENNGCNWYTIPIIITHLLVRFWSFVNLCYFSNNDYVENNTKSIYDVDDNYIIKNIYILSTVLFWCSMAALLIWGLYVWTTKTCARVAKLENEIKKMKRNEIVET